MPIRMFNGTYYIYPREKFPMDVWESVMLADLDPRLPKEHIIELIKRGHTMSTTYSTRNVYIFPALKKVIRIFRKIEEKKGNKMTFDDAAIIICTRGFIHESIHKSLYETIGLEEAMKYDVLVGGKSEAHISGACSILEENILQ